MWISRLLAPWLRGCLAPEEIYRSLAPGRLGPTEAGNSPAGPSESEDMAPRVWPQGSRKRSLRRIQRIQAQGARNARDSSHRLFDPSPPSPVRIFGTPLPTINPSDLET